MIRGAVGILGSIALLTGCANAAPEDNQSRAAQSARGSSSPGETGNETADELAKGTSAEPHEEAASSPSSSKAHGITAPTLSHSWTDKDGYSFTWDVRNPRISTTSNIEDQSPGEVLITAAIEGEVRVTNTTAERSASAPLMKLMAAFPADSMVCGAKGAGSAIKTMYYDDGTLGGFSETGYCYLNGPNGISLDRELTAGESVSAPYATDFHFEYEGGDLIVEEKHLEQVLDELRNPTFWALSGSDTLDPESADQHRCSASNGDVVVTSAGGLHICEQDVK